MQKYFFLLVLLLTFSGCVSQTNNSYKVKYLHSTQTTDFTSITKSLLDDLCPTLNTLSKKIPITVIDFTNIKELENYSELGFLLSEEIKTHVTQECNWAVNQIEFMRYLKIGATGTKLFSRDYQDIKNEQLNDKGYALVGTYAFTQRQLILYLKIIDLKKGVIVKSSTKVTTLTDEIILLERKDIPKVEHTKTTRDAYRPMVL